VPAGGVLLATCGLVALAGFPLDDIWHRLFGQDVTAWGPTHVQMIGGASLSTLACWVRTVEGRRAAAAVGTEPTRLGRAHVAAMDVGLAGAFLIGLSTLQVEFDYGVPQFRLLEHPVLVTIAAACALVAARVRVGRGGALAAVVFFHVVRGALALGVDASGRVDLHVPLYVASAVVVELVALAVDARRRPVAFGVLAGLGVATAGFAAEWAWTREQLPIGWSGALLPEAVPVVLAAGIGAGILGGLVGRALTAEPVAGPTPRGALAVGWIGAVGAVAFALPMTAHTDWRADLDVRPVAGDADLADVAVRLDPPDAAADAAWFEVLWWQGAAEGGDGGSSRTALVRGDDGTYRTAAPVPIGGTGKTVLRLHVGTSLQSVPVFLPEDEAIPAPAVPATSGTRELVADKRVLQREARTDNVGLERVAYVLLGLVAAAWMAVLSWGLRRLDPTPRRGGRGQVGRRTVGAPSRPVRRRLGDPAPGL